MGTRSTVLLASVFAAETALKSTGAQAWSVVFCTRAGVLLRRGFLASTRKTAAGNTLFGVPLKGKAIRVRRHDCIFAGFVEEGFLTNAALQYPVLG